VSSVALLGVAAVSSADEPLAEPPVLHEYVSPPRGAAGSGPRVLDPRAAADPDAEADPRTNPAAIRQGEKLLVEPSKSPGQRPGEPILGPGVSPDRDTQATPDYTTRADGTLHYSEVFNPAIVPFKRMSALDAVRSSYSLYVHDPGLTDVPVGGDLTRDRDMFWGSMLIELRPGQAVALPSVAPDMRILSYEVAPLADLVFSRDGADNYYVRSDDPVVSGQYRLVFLVDAPATYFATTLPEGYTVGGVQSLGLAKPVPVRVKQTARDVLEMLRIAPSTPLEDAVNTMVHYFRGFEAGPSPEPTGDIYWDLTIGKTGVCRHRAFAFMVTANAAGIPARYVTNEAHAFAEIWVPERNWVRVDLGGAALELDVANAEDKAMYRPRAEDPFPKPPEYTENYTRLRGAIDGLTPDQIAEAQTPLDPDAFPSDPRSTDPIDAPRTRLPRADGAAGSGKRPTAVEVGTVADVAFRGETLRVTGRALSEGRAAAGLRIDVYLVPQGETEGARRVGDTVTSQDGSWSVTIDLPSDLDVGSHEVYAHTPGDASHASAISE
jgi:hypothetical protein